MACSMYFIINIYITLNKWNRKRENKTLKIMENVIYCSVIELPVIIEWKIYMQIALAQASW